MFPTRNLFGCKQTTQEAPLLENDVCSGVALEKEEQMRKQNGPRYLLKWLLSAAECRQKVIRDGHSNETC